MWKSLTEQRFLGVRWKLVLPLAGSILLLLFVLLPITNRMVTAQYEQEADRRLGEIADSVGALIASSEDLARNNAILLSSQPNVTQAFSNLALYSDTLMKRRETLKLQELSLYGANFQPGDPAYFYGGPPVTRRLQVSEDAAKIRENLILQAIERGEAISGISISPQNSQVLGVAPVLDSRNGETLGVVLTAFYLDQSYVQNIRKVIATDLALVKDNSIIVSTIDAATGYESLVKQGWAANPEQLPSFNAKNGEGRNYRVLAHPLEVSGTQQGAVVVSQPIDQLLAVANNVQTILLMIVGVFSLTTLWFWISAFLAFSRPLSALTEATTRMTMGEFNQRVDTRYLLFRDEITVLSENFNNMASHLSNLYSSLEERVQKRTLELVEERNKLEAAMQDLEDARDAAIIANKSKSEFVSIVSHELKIPMTSIKGYSDLMLAGATGPLSDAQTNFLKTIRNNVSRMATLVSDLADISRIETGNLRIEPREVTVSDAIDEVINSASNAIEQKKQTILTEIEPDLPNAWCDKNRLSQILTNLISNANKYTPESGAIVVRARKVDENGKAMIQIQVQDDGLGMTPEDQEKLFSKFFRSADDKIREAPGTGLGLNITKNLIELQGGRIWFESEFRKGTSFFFTIPIQHA